MPKETQSALANNVRDVEQAGTMQDFIVRYEVVPSDVQDASLALYVEWIQFIPVGLYEGPPSRSLSHRVVLVVVVLRVEY